LSIRDRCALSVFTAGSDGETEICADFCHFLQHVRAISRQCCATHRLADATLFDQITLGHFENEISGNGIDLPSAHLPDEQPPLHFPHDGFGSSIARSYEGVGHAHDGPGVIRLPPPVAGRSAAVLHGGQPVVQIAFQDAVLDKDRPSGRHPLVVM